MIVKSMSKIKEKNENVKKINKIESRYYASPQSDLYASSIEAEGYEGFGNKILFL